MRRIMSEYQHWPGNCLTEGLADGPVPGGGFFAAEGVGRFYKSQGFIDFIAKTEILFPGIKKVATFLRNAHKTWATTVQADLG